MKSIFLFPIVLVLAIYFMIANVVPLYKDARVTHEGIPQKEKELQSLNEDSKRISVLENEINNHVEAQDFLATFVPADATEQEVVNAVSRFSTDRNIDVESVNFGEPTLKLDREGLADSATLHKGTILAAGSYEDLAGFTNDLFRMKRLYEFESLVLERQETPLGQDFGLNNRLSLEATFVYVHLDDLPAVTLVDMRSKEIVYDSIATIESIAKSVNRIDDALPGRSNPFLP